MTYPQEHKCPVWKDSAILCLLILVPACSTLAGSPWPEYGRDAGNSRRSCYVGSATNRVKWELDLGCPICSSPVITSDGTIFVASTNGTLKALVDLGASASQAWEFVTARISGPPTLGPSNTLYIACTDSNLLAISTDLDIASQKWAFAADSSLESSPVMGTNDTVYFCSSGGTLYALEDLGTTSSVKWTLTVSNTIHCSPVIDQDGVIYFGTDDRTLYAVRDTGTSATQL